MSDGLLVIGKILENGAREALREIDPELLEENEVGVLRSVRTHIRRHRELPTIETVEDDTGIAIPPTPEPLSFYIEKLEDRYLFNELKPGMAQLRQNMKDHEMHDAVATVEGMARVGRMLRRDRQLVTPQEMNDIVMRQYEQTRIDGIVPGLTTGYTDIDQRTLGHQNGDLNVIVARMGVGKTMIALRNLLKMQEDDANVLFVSMEMPIDQLGRRIHSLRTGINSKAILAGRLDWYEDRRMRESVDAVATWNNVHLYNANMIGTVDDIEDLAAQLNPDAIFIDGMYLLKSQQYGSRNTDRNMNVAYVTDEAKRLAVVVNRPVIATTQFNRKAGEGGKFGNLETLGFTDTLAQHGSLVWALKHGDTPLERIMDGLKAREGGVGNLRVNYVLPPDGAMNFEAIEWFVPEAEDEDQPRRRRRRRQDSGPNLDYMN